MAHTVRQPSGGRGVESPCRPTGPESPRRSHENATPASSPRPTRGRWLEGTAGRLPRRVGCRTPIGRAAEGCGTWWARPDVPTSRRVGRSSTTADPCADPWRFRRSARRPAVPSRADPTAPAPARPARPASRAKPKDADGHPGTAPSAAGWSWAVAHRYTPRRPFPSPGACSSCRVRSRPAEPESTSGRLRTDTAAPASDDPRCHRGPATTSPAPPTGPDKPARPPPGNADKESSRRPFGLSQPQSSGHYRRWGRKRG